MVRVWCLRKSLYFVSISYIVRVLDYFSFSVIGSLILSVFLSLSLPYSFLSFSLPCYLVPLPLSFLPPPLPSPFLLPLSLPHSLSTFLSFSLLPEGLSDLEERADFPESGAHREDHDAEEEQHLDDGHEHVAEVACLEEALLDPSVVLDQGCLAEGERGKRSDEYGAKENLGIKVDYCIIYFVTSNIPDIGGNKMKDKIKDKIRYGANLHTKFVLKIIS